MTSLYSEVKGKGRDVVLLHGWGMHGGIWGRFAERLAENFRIHLVDLPGYGLSKDGDADYSFEAVTEVIEEYISTIKKPVILIGWSLGGLYTLNVIRKGVSNIDKLVLLASSPCFTKKAGWVDAMEQSVFDNFSADLKNDYKKTLKRFLSLQTRGSEQAKEDLCELNNKLLKRGEPDFNTLVSGLDILSKIDMRDKNKVTLPAMVLLGEKDTLVPVTVMNEYEKTFTKLEKVILDKTGHAPFISSPGECAEKIKNFIDG